MNKQQLKRKLSEKRYFYLEDNEFHGDYGTKKNPFVVFETKGKWDTEERRASALAQKLFKKKLAGGMFSDDAKPYDFEKNYVVVKVPKIVKPLKHKHDLVDDLMTYESGEMSSQNVKKLFNKLRKSGVGKHLQGHYSSQM